MAAAVSPSWGPVQPEERIALIDVLRGISLFGIIAANMRGFAGPHITYFNTSLLWTTRTDFWTQAFVDTFIQGKFITLFAFLFGVGFSLQFSRAEARGSRFGPIYRRRLFALILLGLLHQVLFWWGDILMTYGLGGFLLMQFRKRKSKTVLIWALSLMTLPIVGMAGYTIFRQIRPPTPQRLEQIRIRGVRDKLEQRQELTNVVNAFQSGTYPQLFRARLDEVKEELTGQPGVVAYTLPLFLLGLWVFRRGILQDPESNRALLKKGLVLGLALGIPMNIGATWLQYFYDLQPRTGGPTPIMSAMIALRIFGRPVLSMGYACAIALLFMTETWRRRILPFGAIGRTALSNYLLQTIVGTTIFYSYGGGLFARVHLTWLFVLSIVIYALEVPLFGPVEWLWRTMTYGKPPGMKRELAAAATS
jgi:uncharacterized protein